MMCEFRKRHCITGRAATRFCANLKWLALLAVAALLVTLCPAQEEPTRDDQYFEIFNLIQQADTLSAGTNISRALAKYQKAESALLEFHKSYPDFDVKAVSFRLNYLAEKIAACSAKLSPAASPKESPPEAQSAAPAGTVEVKLLEAGAEPRKALRLHPNPGDKQTLLMTMKMGMDRNLAKSRTRQ